MDKSNKKRCVKCESTQVYKRLQLNQYVCRICGHIENLEIKKEEQE